MSEKSIISNFYRKCVGGSKNIFSFLRLKRLSSFADLMRYIKKSFAKIEKKIKSDIMR